jgi:carboxypeptidase Q
MYRFLFTSTIILFSSLAFAQKEDSLFIRKIADEILVNGKAYSNLYTLTKTVGGRITGSPQMYKAEEWAQKALKDAGADKVWLQECKVPRWVRGGKDEAKLINGNKEESLAVIA